MKGSVSKIKLNAKTTKKQHVLLLFLLISSLFWLLTKLSKEYETKVLYQVYYVQLPSSKLFQNTPEPTVELIIKSTGFNLLQEKLQKKTLRIDLRKVIAKGGYDYYLLLESQQYRTQSQLEKNIELIGFAKDTLFFELGFNKRKKIPVITNFDLRFKSGYNLSSAMLISPDSIEVSGPEIQVDKIEAIHTSLLQLEDIAEDMNYKIPISKEGTLDKLQYSDEEIAVVGQVEKFTEDSFHVPFEIVGLPKDTKITTYPNTVEVVFQVGLSNYKKIAGSDFRIVCDYNKAASENRRFLVPELVEKPSLVSAIKMIPNHIEYLIQK